MKVFSITMPFTGIAFKEIEAETEEEAIQKFHEEVTSSDFEEWDCCEHIVQGNVFYGIQNEMEIEEEEIDNED